jgi:hypothetical protein
MHATLSLLNALSFPAIARGQLQALQVNLTYLCNQRCLHCHVNAGPTRTEAMTDESLAMQTWLIFSPSKRWKSVPPCRAIRAITSISSAAMAC